MMAAVRREVWSACCRRPREQENCAAAPSPSAAVGELAFGIGSPRDEHVKVGVLVGSLSSALLAAVVLRTRNRAYRRFAERESRDVDEDGIPDIYQRGA